MDWNECKLIHVNFLFHFCTFSDIHNSLAPERWGNNFMEMICSCEIGLRSVPWNSIEDKTTLGSGSGLEPSINKPLPGPLLTQVYIALVESQGHNELSNCRRKPYSYEIYAKLENHECSELCYGSNWNPNLMAMSFHFYILHSHLWNDILHVHIQHFEATTFPNMFESKITFWWDMRVLIEISLVTWFTEIPNPDW